MRLLITGDWHHDWHTAGFARANDVEEAVEETVEAARAESVQLYCFLGDLTNPDRGRSHAAAGFAARVAARLYYRHQISSVWLTGNHDVVEDGSGASTLAALAGAWDGTRDPQSGRLREGATVYDRPALVREVLGRDVDLIALPYTPWAKNYDPAAFVRECAASSVASKVIVLGHLNLEGIVPGSETLDMPRGRDVFYPVEAVVSSFGDRAVMFNGHYHQRQVYRGVRMPGSLERLGFGELRNEPGWLIVDVEAGNAQA